jgi:hypothetical protein
MPVTPSENVTVDVSVAPVDSKSRITQRVQPLDDPALDGRQLTTEGWTRRDLGSSASRPDFERRAP